MVYVCGGDECGVGEGVCVGWRERGWCVWGFECAQALSHATSIHPDVQTLNESLASDTIFCLEQLPGLPISLAC